MHIIIIQPQFFFKKILQILNYIIKEKNCLLSNIEIYHIFKSEKLLLLHLFESQILIPDESISNSIIKNQEDLNGFKYCHFFYHIIKPFISETEQKKIEDEILNITSSETLNEFNEKIHIGENDLYICSLIREDLVEEFISYVNRKNLTLWKVKIPVSIYETNSFLIGKELTLVEYAAFFGSIQIFQYLKMNGVKLKGLLWHFAVHSKNPDLIHLLEENHVIPSDKIYEQCLLESIKCHHNEIAEYIRGNLLKNANGTNYLEFELSEIYDSIIANNQNYHFYPDKIDYLIADYKYNCPRFNISHLLGSIKIITIPSSVEKIVDDAFSDCCNIEKVIIPSSVKKIGSYVFENCSSLKVISITSSLETVGIEIFKGVETIEVVGDITKIFSNFFKDCKELTHVSIPSSVTEIQEYSFSGCNSLIDIIIPPNLKVIESFSFNECNSLKEIVLPSFITSIGEYAFAGCSLLMSITIPSSVTFLGDYAFYNCWSLEELIIPPQIKLINKGTFYGCTSLTKIEIPTSVNKIGDSAFYCCSSLKKIVIPDSVTSIGDSAFLSCSSLTEILIASSVTEIGDYAFKKCTSLKEISIPTSVISFGIHAL